ncbi:MAG: hypothetical protein BHW10_04225 [Clostridium sp. CAG:307_30_263]|nr:MAG: hypothetical protein BHW10_04225 [Clostridium sp. CAG:307_30_263]
MNYVYNKNLANCTPSKIREFNSLASKLNAKFKLTLGEPDFDTPIEVKDALIEAVKQNHTRYAPTVGNKNLREEICKFEKRVNKVSYEPDEVLITTGSTEALTAALFTLLNQDDEVIVPIPCYALYEPVISYCGAKMIPLDTRPDFQISKGHLEALINNKTKAILLTSPNNPTGTIYDDKTLENIYNIVKDTNILVICDNCYDQLVYGKRRLGFSKYQDIKDQIIVCQSFSKPYAMTGWRLGYMLGNKDLLDKISIIHQYMVVCVNTFVQDAGIKALNFDPKPFIEVYEKRRDYVYNRLIKMKLPVNKPEGAFYVFPCIKEFKMSSFDFCLELVKQKSVALIPGDCFLTDDYVRISYCVDDDTIKNAMDLLEEFVTELRTKK